MTFIRRKGKTKAVWFPKTASVAISQGALLTFDGSGAVTPAISTSTRLVGVARKTVAAADADFALNTLIPVEVPVEPSAEFEATTASASASNVGNAYDLTDSLTVNLSGTSHKVVTVVSIISATKVAVVLNGLFDVDNGA